MSETTDNVVPDRMENVNIYRLDELMTHLKDLEDDPSTPFDAKLFSDIELQLTRRLMDSLYPKHPYGLE